MTTHLLVPVDEACERLQLGRTTVYGLLRSGQLPSVYVGRRRLVPAEALDAFVQSLVAQADRASA